MIYTDYTVLVMVMLVMVIGRFLIRKLPKKRYNLIYFLLTGTAVFCYAKNEPAYLLFFLLSVGGNVLAGRGVYSIRKEWLRKTVFIAAVAADALLLAAAKVCGAMDNSFVIPLGLSFLTFREISYLADMYARKVTPFADPMCDAAYITMFTQMLSGPITKYKEFVEADRYADGFEDAAFVNNLTGGVERIMAGLAKKILIADTLAVITNRAFGMPVEELPIQFAWVGAVCYSLQLYYDFSGYSDMAIGFTELLGFRCPENFNYPYMSGSISEFWRRWHITLGSWFRDYVYFPLGGSRVSKGRVFLNLLVVWLLTGLWHGVDLSFVIWGMIHCTFAVIEHFTGVSKTEKKPLQIVWRIVTLLAVVLAWVMFRAENAAHGLLFIKAMFVPNTGVNLASFTYCMQSYWWLMIVAAVFALPVVPKLRERCGEGKAAVVYDAVSAAVLVLLFVLAMAMSANRLNDTFAYANF
ncbi:MAG: hypothetical protein K5695_09965 [Oscillospiraceae bacterium]|nr:hypothetical protein [Oscillospiraceae bacterium]